MAQSCMALFDPVVCSPSGSSVHGLLQARVLEQVVIFFSRGLPYPGIETSSLVSPELADRLFTTVPPGKPLSNYRCVNVFSSYASVKIMYLPQTK